MNPARIGVCPRVSRLQALELLGEMDELGVVPTEACFAAAIAACAEVGQWREACDVIKTMRCVLCAVSFVTLLEPITLVLHCYYTIVKLSSRILVMHHYDTVITP